MIARRNRFHGHNSVAKVRGARLQTPFFRVFYSRNNKRNDFRMAVVISKKTAKTAIVRNRIRRRLYEAVRKAEILNGEPLDVVFVVNDETVARVPASQLEKQVIKTCKQMKKS